MLISVIIPCYYSEKTIRKVSEMVMEEFDKNPGYECEMVLVNDGSTDGTFQEIRSLCEEHDNIRGINLMRNFGQHNALMAGLNYTSGDYVLGMDDDMQTHPSQIFKLIHKIEEGYDLVYGIYPEVKNSAIKNLTSIINRKTSRVMLSRPKEVESSNFWIITSAVRDEVVKYDTFNPYVDAIFYRVTNNIGMVPVEHFKREYGSSGYTFKKLLKLWLAYWNFSIIPLRVSFFFGLLAAAGGIILTIVLIINRLLYPDIPLGWSSTMCAMVFLFGIVLMVLGIIGEYLGKIILILNNTPQYIIREAIHLGGVYPGTMVQQEVNTDRAEAPVQMEKIAASEETKEETEAR